MINQIKVSSIFTMFACLLISCISPSTTSPASPDSSIKPGGSIGEMILIVSKNGGDQAEIFDSCSPIIAESDPMVILRTCNVPLVSKIFIGYGGLATSWEEMDSTWSTEVWQLYIDGYAVDLTAFGFLDDEWEGYKRRTWAIAIDNLSPGEHRLRYVIGKVDNSTEPYDITWIFTVGGASSSTTPSGAIQKLTYPALSSSANFGQHPYTSEKANINLLLYLPNEYGKDAQQKWPLILFLHGMAERGNNLDYLKVGGLPKKLDGGNDFPFVVISPQIESQDGYWSADETTTSLFTLLEEIKAIFSIDPKRIYLTGVSLGGAGTWEIGLRYPDRFAALVPVMGYYGWPFGTPENICDLKNVPIWAFHGAKDETVPLSAEEDLVNALKTCSGNIQFTVYPDAGHDIADETYANPDLYAWMLSQILK